MKPFNKILVENVALNSSGTASVETEVVEMEHLFVSSVHTKWTKTGGTVAGTIVNKKSNDGTFWLDIDSTNLTDANGSSGKEYTDIGYRYFKSLITLTGGAATIYQVVNAKGA